MRRALVPALLSILLTLCPGPAPAQVTVTTPPPPVSIVDRNGIDLRGGKLARHHFEISIGAIDRPAIDVVEGRTGAASKIGTAIGGHVEQIHCDRATYNYCYRWRYVTFGGYAEWHLREGVDSESNRFVSASGGVYETAVGGGRLTLPDGTVVQYDSSRVEPYSCKLEPCPSPYLSEMFASAVRPDGEQITSNSRVDRALPGGRTVVRSTTGFAGIFGNGVETLYNVVVVSCDATGQCASSNTKWPSSTISLSTSVSSFTDCATCDLTDALGHVAHSELSADSKTRSFRTRSGRIYSYTLKPYWSGFFQGLSAFTEGGETTTYDYTIDPQSGAYDPRLIAAKATYPNGDTFSYRKGDASYYTRYNDGPETEVSFAAGLAPNGQGGDAPLITRIVYPEGNGLTYTYDSRRNRTSVRVSAKPGSGQPDLVSTASYPATCDQPKTCNKPEFIVDAAGNRTDYSYDPAHGGVLTETRPAGLDGVRPQSRYSYVQLSAHYYDESGQRVSGPPIWRLDHVSSCATRTDCAGTADETVVSYQYDDNLLPVVETRAAGDGSVIATIRRFYDAVGNLIAVDGPLPGDADTVRYAYDADRRLVRQVSPNPTDAAPAAVLVKTFGYDEDDRVTTIVEGSASDSSDAALAGFAPARTTTISYDGAGRKQREAVSADGATQTVTQWSYDANGRAACTAVRMNRASFAALPDDPCTLAPAGDDGADRITRTTYDTAGRVAAVRHAVGTPLEQRSAGYEYSANGKVTAVIDANGARAEMSYDGHDRLAAWYLPSKREIGKADRADYESYSYDANGNRLTLRRRDGRVLSFGYDALDRLVYKGVPAGCAPLQLGDCAEAAATRDVYLDYDLRGLPAYARFGARDGEGITLVHDALGRLSASITALGGHRREVSSRYDEAGNRVALSTPAGSWRYGYDAASRLTSLSDDAGTRLSTWSYDALGRVAAVAEAAAARRRGAMTRSAG